MNSDSSPTREIPDNGVQQVVDIIFSGDSLRKRRVSSIMDDLNALPRESSEGEGENFLLILKDILDPDDEDVEVDIPTFRNGCKALLDKFQESAIFSPCSSPVKSVTNEDDVSPIKCMSFGFTVSDSDNSVCSSPSRDVYRELNRLKDLCENLRRHKERLESSNIDLTDKLFHAGEKNEKLEIRCETLELLKSKYEQRLSNLHDENFRDECLDEAERKYNHLLQEMKLIEKELAKEKKLNYELQEKMLDIDSLIADKVDIQNHADDLHKERDKVWNSLKQAEKNNFSLEVELKNERQMNETLTQNMLELESKIKSLEEYKVTVKDFSKQCDQLIAIVSHFQVTGITMYDSSVDEEPNLQPISLKDELGGSLPALNTSSDYDDSAVVRTPAEVDHGIPPEPGLDVASHVVQNDVDRLQNRLAASVSAGWHLTPWKVFLALVAYFVHIVILAYVLIFFVVKLLSPYFDYRALVRDMPWFVSVGEGSIGPPPV